MVTLSATAMSKLNLRRLRANQRGVATLEFAILMPVYVFFLIAMIEVYQFYRTVTIIDRTAYSIGNLVAEKAVLNDSSSDSDSNNIGVFWTIAPQVATPLDLKTNGTVIITVVKDAGNASPKIAWQRQETSWGMSITWVVCQVFGISPVAAAKDSLTDQPCR